MEDKKQEEKVEAQFIDPGSLSLSMWLLQVIIGGIVWSIVGFFTKLGLDKIFKKKT